jgi:hypothetical protein
MLLYDTLQTSGQHWSLELIDLFTRRPQLNILSTQCKRSLLGSRLPCDCWPDPSRDRLCKLCEQRVSGCSARGSTQENRMSRMWRREASLTVLHKSLKSRVCHRDHFLIISQLVHVVLLPSAAWWTWSSRPSGRSCVQPLQAKSPLLSTLGCRRRALPPPSDGCQGNPEPSGLY